jgi:hypothetical protein
VAIRDGGWDETNLDGMDGRKGVWFARGSGQGGEWEETGRIGGAVVECSARKVIETSSVLPLW